MSRRVVVVGGGVAGLATAYRLAGGSGGAHAVPSDLDVVVLEAEGSPGGKVRSVDVAGIEVEAGPDSLLARKPAGVELCRELGLGPELEAPASSTTLIWTDRGLLPFPSGPFGITTDLGELWRWPGMSRRGKVRAAMDLLRRPAPPGSDGSLGALLRRRLGDEATERLVAPLLGGLFAADVDALSVRATFPELESWERDHGSLIRGARAAARIARDRAAGPIFLRPRGGLRRLTDALCAALGPERVRCGVRVERIEPKGSGYSVWAGGEVWAADSVVIAAPAFVAADLLEGLAPVAARELASVPHVSTAVAVLVYPEGSASALPDSSGFVVPRGRLAMTACTFVSRKWPDEALGDRAVVRCFVGSAGVEDVAFAPEEDIVWGVSRQLAALLPLPDRPEGARVVRWPTAMPQYEVGHLERVDRIERALPPGMFVVGQTYRGVGIPDCIRGAGEVAARLRAYLTGDLEGARVS
ncbi:MAG TPA: protoporphyrinogen oxidase [Actinomycetota bacterium]|nr:protoporphyrinogen oxidase [Actinomycetota bacterium]